MRSFCPFSKELDKIYDILANTPDIRWDRVNELKKLISAGQYHVPAELIAEKMWQEFLMELEEFKDFKE
ncbi:MAG: flagellar biosynthesis anti-sigma factor FlgM [Thermodesulfobacteriota bacterium]